MLSIRNANLVLENEILWNADLLIDNGKIVSFGKNIDIPADAQVLDANGNYVGPGFVDIHVHGNGGAHMWERSPEDVASHHLQHGTTTMVATLAYSQSRESLLNTTKNDGVFHGLGVKSIKKIVSRYKGSFEWSYDMNEKEFVVYIAFKN